MPRLQSTSGGASQPLTVTVQPGNVYATSPRRPLGDASALRAFQRCCRQAPRLSRNHGCKLAVTVPMGEAAALRPEQAPPGVRKAFPTYSRRPSAASPGSMGSRAPGSMGKLPPGGAQLDLDDGRRDRSGSYLCRWSRPPRCCLHWHRACCASGAHEKPGCRPGGQINRLV